MSGKFYVLAGDKWAELPHSVTRTIGIRVESGSTLTLKDCTLVFEGGFDTAILVENGGTLFIDGGQIR